jgi:dTDP-4-dehydrorhamnose 3,5-epimerase
MPFQFRRLSIQEVVLIETKLIDDKRGFFQETFKASEFESHGVTSDFVQDNHSRSLRRTLRGLHYQLPPQAQGKLISVLRGQVFDVAVDIRRGSASYGQWVGQELSDRNGFMLYIPPGFAHGFCVISKEADVSYKVTAEYAPTLERGFIWSDPFVGIEWPISTPSMSVRDAQLPLLQDAENSFEFGQE